MRREPSRAWHRGPLAAVLAAAVVLAFDIADGDRRVLLSLLVAAPLISGLTAGPRSTLAVGAGTVLAAALAGIWNGSFTAWTYWVPLTVTTVGVLAGWTVATLREAARRDTRRLDVLAELGGIADGTRTVPETAAAALDVVVPAIADVAAFDVTGPDGRLRRLAARVAHAPQLEPALVARGAGDGGEELRSLDGTRFSASIAVPLMTRGRRVGVLTLATVDEARRFRPDDVAFAETMAGRMALAVDNAGLSAELSSTERQLETILGKVQAAITVRDAHGRMVYANQAAADLLKLPDVAAVRAAPPGELMSRFDVFDEEGVPIALGDLPGTRIFAGDPDPEPLVVRNVVRATGDERWLLNRASAMRDESGEIVAAVNLIEDITATKRAELAQRLLAEAGRMLTNVVALEDTLQAVAEMAVPGLADWAGVDLPDGRGGLRTVAVAHRDPAKVRLGWKLRTTYPVEPGAGEGLPAVLRTGEPELIEDITDDMLVAGAIDDEHLELLRSLGLRSTMIVPMLAGEDVLGVLSFVASSRRFNADDLALATDLGRQAGVAVQNAQLYSERAAIAHTLQEGLLPDRLPTVPGWELAARYRPAGALNEAGGDFYDVVRDPRGWVLVIGDVAGKGAKAASLTGLARHTLRSIIEVTGDPELALGNLNDALSRREELSLCSVALVLLPDGGHEVEVWSAGHPLPVQRRAARAWRVGKPGPMLGFVEDARWPREIIELRPGDALFLHTDGVSDTVGEHGRFGDERLHDVAGAAGSGAGELVDAVIAALDGFLCGPQPDDIAVLVAART